MNRLHLLIIPAFLILISCAKKTVPQASTTTTIPTSAGITVKDVDFNYFSSKSNFHYKDDDENLEATALIRIKKDSIIWINISPGLGIEAMRAKITPDSIIVVDKIKKQFVVYNFKTLSQRYNFEIDFPLMQNLLLGNLLKEKKEVDQVTREEKFVVLTQKLNNSLIESFINQALSKVERLQISEPGTSNLLSVDYNTFTDIDDRKIPFGVNLDLDYLFQAKKYNVTIDIKHQKAEFVDKGVKFPFNIPAKYERVE
jgi:hypothetical protein